MSEYERNHPEYVSELVEEIEDGPGWALICARTRAGLRQGDLAQRTGIAEEPVRILERGRFAGASLETMQTIAHAIGTRITIVPLVPAT